MHTSHNLGMFAASETESCRPTDLSQFTEAANQMLEKMTLEEKVGQMVQVDSAALKDKEDVRRLGLGSVLSGGNSDPDQGSSPKAWLDFVLQFKSQALQTRLKIPLLFRAAMQPRMPGFGLGPGPESEACPRIKW